jgi:hypothetical protein
MTGTCAGAKDATCSVLLARPVDPVANTHTSGRNNTAKLEISERLIFVYLCLQSCLRQTREIV